MNPVFLLRGFCNELVAFGKLSAECSWSFRADEVVRDALFGKRVLAVLEYMDNNTINNG